MNRRRALAAIGVSALVAGCYSPHHGGITADVPPAVTALEFERIDPDYATVGVEDDPRASAHWDASTVAVEGNLYVGHYECYQAVIEEVDVNGTELTVGIGSGTSPNHPNHSVLRFGCPQVLSPCGYRFHASFDSVVDRIVIEERDEHLGTRTVTLTPDSRDE